MEWKFEVDVLCVGSGMGGLATAIASVDAGEDVFVADSSGIDVADDETNDYFDELSHDQLVRVAAAPVVDMPIRVIEDLAPVPSTTRVVQPFIGSRLRDWAAGCLNSPSGFLYSRVAERRDVTMRSSRGEPFEVTTVGSVELGPDRPPWVLGDWLYTQARDRDIEVCTDSPLQRIVFEDGQVVGAVLATPSGILAVRARRGVLVSTGRHHPGATLPCNLPEQATLHVGVVRQAPSRFGRIELLTTQPLTATPHTTCRPMNRHLTVLAQETRQSSSPNWRCGELHRYPPLGQ